MRVGLLVNPTAGRKRAARYHAGLAGVIRRAGHLVIDLTGPDAPTAQANASAHLAGVDAVVVMGGDGAVQLALNVVAGTDIPLGIVPVGTGNDNATGLGLPKDPADALKLILRQLHDAPRGVPTDAISVTTTRGHKWAMATLNCGFDATTNERANEMVHPKNGLRYVRALLDRLPSYESAIYQIRGDDWEWEGAAFLVGVSNIGYIGGGMHLAPEAVPDDGLLDVVIVRADISKPEILTVFPRIFNGSHVTHPAVQIMRSREISISDNQGHVVFADGEPLGHLPLTARAVPGAVNIFRPETPLPRSQRPAKRGTKRVGDHEETT